MASAFGNPTARKNVSYLCARDPSILACGPLQSSENLTENISKEAPEDKTHLRIYLRMKKTDNYTKELYEISDENTLLCKLPPVTCCDKDMSSSVTKVFTFSRIFATDAKQIDIFNDVVKAKLLHFMNGYNCNLFTYGASGSGKTYTVVGTMQEPGILPRSLEYLFRTLPELPEEPRFKPRPLGGIRKLPKNVRKYERSLTRRLLEKIVLSSDSSAHINAYREMQQRLSNESVAKVADDITEDVSFGVWVSFTEIYNETVHDLLIYQLPRRNERVNLQLGQCDDNGYIKDLTYINVRSGLEAYQILQYGIRNLQYAATSVNQHSSRSHGIFTIMLVQASDIQKGYSVSAFNFCDLAGAERAKKTNNVGDRLTESKNINKSLMILGRCLSVIRDCQKVKASNKVVPFRESKLTSLFQKALLGHEMIFMIVNINTTKSMFDQSLHVLNFSATAKHINIVEQQLGDSQPQNNGSSTIHPITEEKEQNISDDAALQIRELTLLIEKERLDAEEESDHIMNAYENSLLETNEFWEDRYRTLEERLTQSRCSLQASNEEASSSVACLGNSSSSCEEQTSGSYTNAQILFAKLIQQLQRKELVKNLPEDNATLEQVLDDTVKRNKELEVQYKGPIEQMQEHIVAEEDQISSSVTCLDNSRSSCEEETTGGYTKSQIELAKLILQLQLKEFVKNLPNDKATLEQVLHDTLKRNKELEVQYKGLIEQMQKHIVGQEDQTSSSVTCLDNSSSSCKEETSGSYRNAQIALVKLIQHLQRKELVKNLPDDNATLEQVLHDTLKRNKELEVQYKGPIEQMQKHTVGQEDETSSSVTCLDNSSSSCEEETGGSYTNAQIALVKLIQHLQRKELIKNLPDDNATLEQGLDDTVKGNKVLEVQYKGPIEQMQKHIVGQEDQTSSSVTCLDNSSSSCKEETSGSYRNAQIALVKLIQHLQRKELVKNLPDDNATLEQVLDDTVKGNKVLEVQYKGPIEQMQKHIVGQEDETSSSVTCLDNSSSSCEEETGGSYTNAQIALVKLIQHLQRKELVKNLPDDNATLEQGLDDTVKGNKVLEVQYKGPIEQMQKHIVGQEDQTSSSVTCLDNSSSSCKEETSGSYRNAQIALVKLIQHLQRKELVKNLPDDNATLEQVLDDTVKGNKVLEVQYKGPIEQMQKHIVGQEDETSSSVTCLDNSSSSCEEETGGSYTNAQIALVKLIQHLQRKELVKNLPDDNATLEQGLDDTVKGNKVLEVQYKGPIEQMQKHTVGQEDETSSSVTCLDNSSSSCEEETGGSYTNAQIALVKLIQHLQRKELVKNLPDDNATLEQVLDDTVKGNKVLEVQYKGPIEQMQKHIVGQEDQTSSSVTCLDNSSSSCDEETGGSYTNAQIALAKLIQHLQRKELVKNLPDDNATLEQGLDDTVKGNKVLEVQYKGPIEQMQKHTVGQEDETSSSVTCLDNSSSSCKEETSGSYRNAQIALVKLIQHLQRKELVKNLPDDNATLEQVVDDTVKRNKN